MSRSASSARARSRVEVELLNVPRGIVEHEEAELIESGRPRGRRPAQVGPSELAARQQAGDLPLRRAVHAAASRSIGRSRPARPSGSPSRAAPAHCRTPGSNRQRSGSSIRPSFTPSSASHASTTARCSSCLSLVDRRPASLCSQRLRDPDRLRRAPGPVEAGRAGDDAVEVVREALRFLHRLPAAGRAAVPVRELRRAAVVAGDDRLGLRPSSRERRASRSRSTFSGCPSAKLALPPVCPVSVELVA